MSEVFSLPVPRIENWDWQHSGACRDLDTEIFFHPEGERGATRKRRAAEAKRICALCPVRSTCAEHALMVREPYGIWGGMTEEERRSYLRLQARAS